MSVNSRSPSVLLGFRCENVLSFRDEAEISMLSGRLGEPKVAREVPWSDRGDVVRVLPAAGVFGPNASGKSNLLAAMGLMRNLVLTSFRHGDPTSALDHRPFKLASPAARSDSSLEVDLILDGVRTTYGFTYSATGVVEEWLHASPRGRDALVFERSGRVVNAGPRFRSHVRAIVPLLRDNALFLSTAAAANFEPAVALYAWFGRNLLLAEESSRAYRQVFSVEMLDDIQRRDQILALLRAADLGIVDARRKERDPVTAERARRALRILHGLEADGDGPTIEELGVRLVHLGEAGPMEFEEHEESLGTMVWLGLVGPVVDALARGSVLLADELQASLHPALVAQLIRLFQSAQTNPRRAQLIFNSHDPTLLGDSDEGRLLGRDQIWFADKSSTGASRMYSLADFDPRKGEAVGRRYLKGRYGAVPVLSDAEFAAVGDLITTSIPT